MRRITALSIVLATIGLVGFPGGAGAATGVGGALAGDQVYGQWLYGELFVRHARDGEPSRPKTVSTSGSNQTLGTPGQLRKPLKCLTQPWTLLFDFNH